MPSAFSRLLRRPPGSGWLVLSGGSLPEDLIPRALALVTHAGSVIAVVPSPAELTRAETEIQTWNDISGRDGRVVDCESSGDLLEESISEAALVLLPDVAAAADYSHALGQTDACDFLLAALDEGAMIIAEGPSAEALGEEIEEPRKGAGGELSGSPGLRWLPGAVVQTHFSEGRPAPVSLKRKDRFRIGIPDGMAIAIGPGEEREIWGEGRPTITFGEWWKE